MYLAMQTRIAVIVARCREKPARVKCVKVNGPAAALHSLTLKQGTEGRRISKYVRTEPS